MQRRSEPEDTVFGPRWREARARLGTLDQRQQELFSRLLAHLEAGWAAGVRELQSIYQRNAHLESSAGALADVLAFIDADVVDLYRIIAFDAADLVPGWIGWRESADPGDMDGDSSEFDRYVGVLRLAAHSPDLPENIRAEVELACSGLTGWYRQLSELLRALDEEVIRPTLLPEQHQAA